MITENSLPYSVALPQERPYKPRTSLRAVSPAVRKYRSDQSLVRSCFAGDQNAWNELVTRYQRLIYSIPRKYGLSEADAEDVMQNVFMIIYRRLETLRDLTLLSAWIIRITHRATLHFSRRGLSHCELDEALPDDREPPETLVQRMEAQHLVQQALERLDPSTQTLLRLFLQETPPSYEEISRRMRCPLGSIGPTRARAFKKLETVLREMHFDLSF